MDLNQQSIDNCIKSENIDDLFNLPPSTPLIPTSLDDLPDDLLERIIYINYRQSGNSVSSILPILYTNKRMYNSFHFLVYKLTIPLVLSNEIINKGGWFNPFIPSRKRKKEKVNKLHYDELESLQMNPFDCASIKHLVIEYNYRQSFSQSFYDSTKSSRVFDQLLNSMLSKLIYLNSIELDITDIYGLRILNYIQENCSSLDHLYLTIHDYKYSKFNKVELYKDLITSYNQIVNNNKDKKSFKLKTFSLRSPNGPILSSTVHTSLLIAGGFEMTPQLINQYYKSPLVRSFEGFLNNHSKAGLVSLGKYLYQFIDANRNHLTKLELLGFDLYILFSSILEPDGLNSLPAFSFPNLKLIHVNDASYLRISHWLFKFNSKFPMAILYHSHFSGKLSIIHLQPLHPIDKTRTCAIWQTNEQVSYSIKGTTRRYLAQVEPINPLVT
ncbi:hypothetical protein DFJ63DRAFT_332926 [Scheffersomyces coipomensis]|uniref:uncharacterized protein n=1 Tax=Scheffersomyces coipomensis TaxID=1788519 RepID=UPI00315DE4BC